MSTGRAAFEVAGAVAVALALTAVAFREGPLLTFDGYHYCEYAKRFAAEWPDRFGLHWPVGFPLAGGLLGRTGVPGYVALIVVSTLALAFLLALARGMAPARLRWPVLAIIAASPIVALQLGGVLSELPFAAAWIGLAFALAHWPSRWALWAAAASGVLAIAIRYAGGLALVLMPIWGLFRWQELRQAGRRVEAIVAWVAAGGVVAALLAINVARSGHISGAGRGMLDGFAGLPGHATDFGWSLPAALVAGGLRDRVGAHSTTGLLLGGVLFTTLVVFCVWAWLRPRSAVTRPLALATVGYIIGMVALRCVGEFDALYNARTFLPIFAPLLLLAAERVSERSWWTAAGCAGLIGCGMLAAARGVSREIGADVRAAVAPIRRSIAPGDQIAVNDNAFSVSAWFAQRTFRYFLVNPHEHPPARFIVVAGKPRDRAGRGAECPPSWVSFCAELVAQQDYRYLVREPHLIALERNVPP